MRTKELSDHLFTEVAGFEEADYSRIYGTLQEIVADATEVRSLGAPESQLISTVIMPMLNLACRLLPFKEQGQQVQRYDLTTTQISPPDLCSYADQDEFKDLAKRIDAALGLCLDEDETEQLERGRYNGVGSSINQTQSFVNLVPLFLNIEVKQRHQDVDPLIQLGAWIAAEFEKRRIEDYPLDMPTLALEINGDFWELYIVNAVQFKVPSWVNKPQPDDYKLQFLGPIDVGTTRDLAGAFKILDTLRRCIKWGNGPFREWVGKNIISQYKRD